ncbi:transposase [Streptomyces sp. NPDC127084]|uniref:transposase n=1 Tax=Streptomyces sp. NPDC127084 TaxID=3347133 RepID=UPI00365B8088
MQDSAGRGARCAVLGPWNRSKGRDFEGKDADHRPLHPPAGRCNGRLLRRARAGDPTHLPAAPGWPPDGHRIKSEIDHGRGPEKTWVYGGLRVADGQEITMTASSRNSAFYQQFLQELEDANPADDIYVITDNLSSHNRVSIRAWLDEHPRIRHVFIPVGACWFNLPEGWWCVFRKTAFARQSVANPTEIEQATRLATTQLNARARPWGRPAPPTRRLRL